jgi:NAD(P)-dependent dehydrogenase (short-subunit alcohol dehydrogenase family)
MSSETEASPCLVTGGASGIGVAFAELALARGQHCAVIDLARPVEPALRASFDEVFRQKGS